MDNECLQKLLMIITFIIVSREKNECIHNWFSFSLKNIKKTRFV